MTEDIRNQMNYSKQDVYFRYGIVYSLKINVFFPRFFLVCVESKILMQNPRIKKRINV